VTVQPCSYDRKGPTHGEEIDAPTMVTSKVCEGSDRVPAIS